MDPALGPISPDLWLRLKRLDRHCQITMQRRQPKGPQGENLPKYWRVSIHHDQAMVWEHVVAERPGLGEALAQAVEESEGRGWAQDRSSP